MFDMFDSNKSGWLIKLIDEVEEDAIVEVEEGIAVEAVCSVEAIDGSDTMKKPVKLEQAQIYEKWTSTWERERSKEKEKKNRERERELGIQEILKTELWFLDCYNTIHLPYIYNELTPIE